MTRSARAAALRSTALATSLVLAWLVGLVGLDGRSGGQAQGSVAEAAADRAQRRAQHAAAKNTAPAPRPPRRPRLRPPLAPAIPPATRRMPPPPHASRRCRPRSPRRRRPRRPIPRRWKTSSSWCASASPRMRRRREAAISDPVAKKLAEWIILRSDDNGASVERYRAFISANPSWPSQTFLRRRIEAALWDDHRDDATVWAWFENESPLSAKGKFSLARAMIARGDRANAERLVRERLAQRFDVGGYREHGARPVRRAADAGRSQGADGFPALRQRDTRPRMRAAKRLGAGHVALAKARIAANHKARQRQGAARGGARANCMAIPATSSARSSCCAAKRNSPRPPS